MVDVGCQTDDVYIVESKPNSQEEKVKVVIPEYTLRAIKKYQEKNKAELKEKNNSRNKERYQNDPEYREREKQKALERYYRKKSKELIT
jgi:hypothetical protein